MRIVIGDFFFPFPFKFPRTVSNLFQISLAKFSLNFIRGNLKSGLSFIARISPYPDYKRLPFIKLSAAVKYPAKKFYSPLHLNRIAFFVCTKTLRLVHRISAGLVLVPYSSNIALSKRLFFWVNRRPAPSKKFWDWKGWSKLERWKTQVLTYVIFYPACRCKQITDDSISATFLNFSYCNFLYRSSIQTILNR